MSESETPQAPPAPEAPRAARRGRALPWLVVLALLAGGGYGSWHLYRYVSDTIEAVSTQQRLLVRLEREVAALHTQSADLATRQSDLSQAVRRNGVDIATMGERLEGSEEMVARLSETVEGGRRRVQLAAVEQLLLLANDRLLLARDVPGALKALDLADRRLASQSDPRLHRVREALAAERAALASVPNPDIAGASLTLAELVRRAPGFPLRARVPEEFEAAPADADAMDADGEWTRRIWPAVKTALASMFTLRRVDTPPPRLLPPEEEALVLRVLQLKLEGARLALLSRDAVAVRDLARTARQWLSDYFNAGDPAVQAAQADLERIAALNLAPELPDITRSLTLLRAQLQPEPQ